MDSDEELMARYVAGDEQAFRALYDRYASRLAGLMRRQIKREHDVQELVQQTFFQLHRARHDFRPGSQLRPWLITIALNLKRRYFRDAHKRGTSLEWDPTAPNTEVSRHAEQDELAGKVRLALQQLPENQREVIELHWYQGLPFAEIGQVLGASLSAVKVRAHRGYKRLRQMLEIG